MAAAAGVEPATCSLGESRSIQLSYATVFCVPFQSRKIYYNPVFAKIKRKRGETALSREADDWKRCSSPCL